MRDQNGSTVTDLVFFLVLKFRQLSKRLDCKIVCQNGQSIIVTTFKSTKRKIVKVIHPYPHSRPGLILAANVINP